MKTITSKYLSAVIAAAVMLVISVQAYAGDENTEISVNSIVCGMCVKKVEKTLKKVEGVKEVKVDLDEKKAYVTFDNSLTDISKLEDAITAAGYDANEKKADPEAYEKLHGCCKIR